MRRPSSGNPSSASPSGLMTPKMKKLARATNTELRLNALRRVRNFRDSSSEKYTVAHLNLTTDVKRHWRQPGSDLTCGYTDRPERLSCSTLLTDHSTPCRHPWEVIRPVVSGGTEDAKARNKGDHDCRLIRLPSRTKPDGSSRDLSVWLGS